MHNAQWSTVIRTGFFKTLYLYIPRNEFYSVKKVRPLLMPYNLAPWKIEHKTLHRDGECMEHLNCVHNRIVDYSIENEYEKVLGSGKNISDESETQNIIVATKIVCPPRCSKTLLWFL